MLSVPSLRHSIQSLSRKSVRIRNFRDQKRDMPEERESQELPSAFSCLFLADTSTSLLRTSVVLALGSHTLIATPTWATLVNQQPHQPEFPHEQQEVGGQMVLLQLAPNKMHGLSE